MQYSKNILRKQLEKLLYGVKKGLQVLNSKLPEKEKLFQIQVAI